MMTTLAEQLGYDKNTKLLIVNADDFGLSFSVNEAIKQLLVEEKISSTSLMMPCAFAKDGAQWFVENPQYDVGIHFTFTSEWDKYKWRPITLNNDIMSLVTDEGYFYSNNLDFELHAVSSQVRQELINQMELALKLGLKPTHADNHMGSLYGLATGQNFITEVLDVCAYYGMPFRLPRYSHEKLQGIVKLEMSPILEQTSQLADIKGVIIPDFLHTLPFEMLEHDNINTYEQQVKQMIVDLPAGVTEVYIHPSIKSSELDYFHKHPQKRVLEYELYQSDFVQQMCHDYSVKIIDWKALQALQRQKNSKNYPY